MWIIAPDSSHIGTAHPHNPIDRATRYLVLPDAGGDASKALFGQEKAKKAEKVLFGHKLLGIFLLKSPFGEKAVFGHEVLRISSNQDKVHYLVLDRKSLRF